MGLVFRKTRKLKKTKKQTRRYRKINKAIQRGGYTIVNDTTTKMFIKYRSDTNTYIQLVSPQMGVDWTEYYSQGRLKKEPMIEIIGLDATKKYLLIMIDPDALGKTWTHWVVVVNGAGGLVRPAIAEYNGPSPPQNSGVHRYIFQLYSLDVMESLPRKLKNDERGSYYADVLSKFVMNKKMVLEASYSVDNK